MTTLSQPEDPPPYAADVFLGDSSAVQRLRLQVSRISPHFRVALLTGEPGAGKLAVARRMHGLSPAASRPFAIIGCTAFAEQTHFPADGSTLYLPSLEALPATSQGRFLRALKLLHRDTRVIVASQSDLRGMVSAGKLRHDLYDAVGTLEIRVAPLRERLDDLEALATAHLRRLSSASTFDAGALTRLRSHAWPGNLEELRNLCEKLAHLSPQITALDLPLPSLTAQPANAPASLEQVMHRHVIDVLESCSGNKLRAAELLGISRSTLYRMLGTQTAA